MFINHRNGTHPSKTPRPTNSSLRRKPIKKKKEKEQNKPIIV